MEAGTECCQLFLFLYSLISHSCGKCTLLLVCGSVFAVPTSPVSDSSCNIPCVAGPFEICGGATTLTIYQFENVTQVLSAFATLTAPTNALVALINSVTALNVQTVGPVSWLFHFRYPLPKIIYFFAFNISISELIVFSFKW